MFCFIFKRERIGWWWLWRKGRTAAHWGWSRQRRDSQEIIRKRKRKATEECAQWMVVFLYKLAQVPPNRTVPAQVSVPGAQPCIRQPHLLQIRQGQTEFQNSIII